MRPQRKILLISLGASVLLHAAASLCAVWYAATHLPTVFTKAPSLQDRIVTDVRPPEDRFVIGKQLGAGNANDDSPLEQPQTALKEWENQAFLTRDPAGLLGAARPAPATPQSLATPAPRELHGVGASGGSALSSIGIPSLRRGDKSPARAETPTPPAPDPSAATPAPAPSPAAPPAPQTPSPDQRPPGLPATPTDRDSDLFAEETAVEIHAGKVVARSGRQVKFARPRNNLAGIVDSATLSFPALLKMLVEIDERGTVRRVVVTRSTGSSSIDRAFELATYESWFEPAKDKSGKPVRDEIEFAILLN